MAVDYTAPTPSEVSALLSALSLTGGQAANLIGLSDSRQVRKYTGGREPRSMSFATLYVLIHRASGREITPDGWREQVGDLL